MTQRSLACPAANHDAILADPDAFAALPLVGYSTDIGIETRRCNRCPSTISRDIAPVADSIHAALTAVVA